MEKLKKSVGIRALAIRERLGYKNREAFAAFLGVHTNTVGFLERGETWLSPEMVVNFRDKLGVNPAEFFSDEPIKIVPTAEEALEVLTNIVRQKSIFLPISVEIIDKLATLDQSDLGAVETLIDTLVTERRNNRVNSSKSKA